MYRLGTCDVGSEWVKVAHRFRCATCVWVAADRRSLSSVCDLLHTTHDQSMSAQKQSVTAQKQHARRLKGGVRPLRSKVLFFVFFFFLIFHFCNNFDFFFKKNFFVF